ncbi:hypothetical protein LCGC14_0813800 [marine sediment metagenome]|uniref:Uncharacterized protein n=1 Tax=marine sediment metagenome TaxID=412755 RepID=A0A0F9STE0_9ZZZZ
MTDERKRYLITYRVRGPRNEWSFNNEIIDRHPMEWLAWVGEEYPTLEHVLTFYDSVADLDDEAIERARKWVNR